jgi:MFS family permease
MALFMVVTAFGPQLAPIVSGFVSEVSWRWAFWVGLAAGGVSYPLILFIPETHVPVLKKRHARKMARLGKEEPKQYAHVNSRGMGNEDSITSIFRRPFKMTAKEPLLLFASLFMGFTYALFYLYFQAYPLIFQSMIFHSVARRKMGRTLTPRPDLYGLSPGVAGLAFLPSMSDRSVYCLALLLMSWAQSAWEHWYRSHFS